MYERLLIDDIDEFELQRADAYDQLNITERDLQDYGDIVDFTGESIVERHDRARRLIKELTKAGIRAGYLNRDLMEV